MCTPRSSSLCNDAVSNELCNIPCAVGAITSFDLPRSIRPIATANVVVTVLSAIPLAILLMVLYVAGATKYMSNGLLSLRCSEAAVSRLTT